MPSALTATFLFTDLVDSTAISARLGPEAADELRKDHFRLLRGAVTAAGGTEVKNLGDGLMVMLTSPSRALACAVGMQQAIEHHNRRADQPLSVRIGISTGEAVEEEGDYFGDPVVEAARLCGLAAGGQILASDLVRLMVGRHAAQSFAALGPLELKGIPEPVETVEVLWEPEAEEGALPLPGRLVGKAADALFGFFGRAPELALLQESRKRARAESRCQAVFLAGEAGMGKTALAAHFARLVHAEGAIVLFGHADEDVGVSHQPWIEVCRVLVRDADPKVAASLAPGQRAAMSRLVPEIEGNTEHIGAPDLERLVLWEAVSTLLAAASTTQSLVVVLDDLHWADTASLQVLHHVITAATPLDVTVVCTYRDTDLHRGDALTKLLADLHREANVARVALHGLADEELLELLEAAAGHDLDELGHGLAHALRRETDGNPFFTAEMLRHLGETGGIVLGTDGRWTVADDIDDLGLPASVRDVIGRRVERLGEEAVRVLCLAAVIGREFDLDVLAALADIDEDPLLDLMDEAVTAAILVESGTGGRYRFVHALTQHSLHDELGQSRRQRAHHRIAEVLEARAGRAPNDLAELAHHWVAATRPAELDKAIGYVIRAGDAARDSLAPDDAMRWYEQALDLLAGQPDPDPRRRAEVLVRLGTMQRRTSDPRARATLCEAADLAERLGADDLLVDVALGFAEHRTGNVGDDDSKRVITAALASLGDDPGPTRARLLGALATSHDAGAEWETRRELSLQALDAARCCGDDATFVHVVESAFAFLSAPDRRDEMFADLERALHAADSLGDPLLQGFIRYSATWARYQQLDLPAVDAVLGEARALAEVIRLPFVDHRVALLTVGRTLLAGRTDEAEVANDRALELGLAADVPEALGAYGGLLYTIRRCQDRVGEIADFFVDAARDNPSIAALRSVLPAMLAGLGRMDEARERFAAEKRAGFEVPFDYTWLDCMANFADAAVALGDDEAARTVLDRLAPYADHVVSPSPVLIQGSAARPLGRLAMMLGEHARAEEWFALAHEVHARLGSPYFTALGQLDHADLCVARGGDGDGERVSELAAAAAAIATERGYPGLARRAAALLDRV